MTPSGELEIDIDKLRWEVDNLRLAAREVETLRQAVRELAEKLEERTRENLRLREELRRWRAA